MASLGNFKAWSAEQLAQFEATRERVSQLSNIDYRAVNQQLLGDALGFLSSWLPNGKKAGKDWVVGDLDGNKGKSLTIDLRTGKWIDFAAGDQGADLVSLYARMHGMTNSEAAVELSGGQPPVSHEIRPSFQQLKPVREILERIWQEAPPWKAQHACIHSQFGKPTRTWLYRNEQGKPIGHVARYDPPGERKQFVPWTWDGADWRPKGWPSARPLYGLDLLAAEAEKPVLIVEGEKAADAARKLTSAFVVVTWPGGASAVSKADLAPLYGRYVLCVPDADEAGRKAMTAIQEALRGKARAVDVRDTSAMPEKWDLADALADGWDAARLDVWLREPFAQQQQAQDAEQKAKASAKKAERVRIERSEPDRLPSHLATIPGVLGEGVAWFLETAKKPQPVYAVQSMLALGSVALGRKYRTTHANWSSLYFLVIGRSATGKEYVKTAAERVLEEAGMHELIGPAKYASEQGMLSSLIEQPCHLAIQDEFGKVLESAKAEKGTLGRDTLRFMMEAWGRCDGTMRATAYSLAGKTSRERDEFKNRFVMKPALTFVGMTTSEPFYDALGSGAIRDGFLNRFIVAECHAERSPMRFVPDVPPPSALVQWCAAQRAASVSGGNLEGVEMATKEPAPIVVAFSADASKRFAAFDVECIGRMNELDKSGMAEMFGRTNEIAMRLSLIVARSCGAAEIGDEHARWAIDYARHWTMETIKAAGAAMNEGEFDAAMKDVERLVHEAGDKGITERELRSFSRKFARLSPRGQKDVMALLAGDGVIELVEAFGGLSHRGKKRQAWVFAYGAE